MTILKSNEYKVMYNDIFLQSPRNKNNSNGIVLFKFQAAKEYQ